MRKVRPKMMNGCGVNGRMLLEMGKAYVESVNGGKLPNIEGAWTYLLDS